MFSKIALTAAVVLGTATVALAGESDPNLLNRYPGYNMTQSGTSLVSRNVALTGSHVATGEQSIFDRASRSTGGGY
jgi:hypothetical protein